MFFNLQSRYILFQVLSGNKYIEKKFFDGIIQEEFFDKANDNKICFPLDLYSAASYYDIGQQLNPRYSNVFIKKDQDDQEVYLSVLKQDEWDPSVWTHERAILENLDKEKN